MPVFGLISVLSQVVHHSKNERVSTPRLSVDTKVER